MTTAVEIDARGVRCPWPALRAARALREGAGTLRVTADDPAARDELAALAAAHGRAFREVSPALFEIAGAAH